MIKRQDLVIKLNHLILIKGFQTQSMSTLAQQVGVSRATLYLNFKNKDDLVEAVVTRHLTFIKDNQLPAFEPTNFLSTWLKALLLLGSTTTTFMTELTTNYPTLASTLTTATEDYLQQLLAYLQQAQAANFLVTNLTPEFMLFQAQALIAQILSEVRQHNLPLLTAETYLKATFTMQLNGLVQPEQQAALDSSQIATFEQTILAEFRATYA